MEHSYTHTHTQTHTHAHTHTHTCMHTVFLINKKCNIIIIIIIIIVIVNNNKNMEHSYTHTHTNTHKHTHTHRAFCLISIIFNTVPFTLWAGETHWCSLCWGVLPGLTWQRVRGVHWTLRACRANPTGPSKGDSRVRGLHINS